MFPKAVESYHSFVYKLRRTREDTCPGTLGSSASFSGATTTQLSTPLSQPCPVLTLKSFGKRLDNILTIERKGPEVSQHNRQDSCVPRNSMSRLLDMRPSSDMPSTSLDSVRPPTHRLVDSGRTPDSQLEGFQEPGMSTPATLP